jgi:8-oxo-dGTP pyrophosphatase MutT (NUDIX family)
MELVDILSPPHFKPTGVVKPVATAIEDGDWIAVANIWLFRSDGTLLYQQRPAVGWEPNKLDGSVGGYYRAGESGPDIMREAREELGWSCAPEKLVLVGHHLSVGLDTHRRQRRLMVTTYMVPYEIELSEFVLCKEEVPAIFELNARDVLQLFSDDTSTVEACGVSCDRHKVTRHVGAQDFTFVFGNYHSKIAYIALKLASGELPPGLLL